MAKLITCEVCGKRISNMASGCPDCGQPQEPISRKRGRILGFVIMATALIYLLYDRSEDVHTLISLLTS